MGGGTRLCMSPDLPLRASRSWILLVLLGGLVRVTPVLGNGNQITDCVHLCPTGWPNVDPCVVESNVTVIAGSAIQCGTRAVIVPNGKSLTVTDGRFSLAAGSLQLTGNGKIVAACATGSNPIGFSVDVTGSVTLLDSGKFDLTCSRGGGTVVANAGTTMTIGGSGVDATGQGSAARGGTIVLHAEDGLTTTAELNATTTSTTNALGGSIELEGDGVTLGGGATVDGAGDRGGGAVVISSRGAVTVNGTGIVSAGASQGPAGSIQIDAVGTVSIQRQLKVRGTNSTGTGGGVSVQGRSIAVLNEITATGGASGGAVSLNAERGDVAIGTSGSTTALIDVSATSTAAGDAGEIRLVSRGGDVTIGGNGRLYASGNSGGRGGGITLDGAAVSTAAGSQVYADDGGGILARAQESTVLGGAVRATNGLILLPYRQTAPVVGNGVIDPVETFVDDALVASCGDGRRRLSAEACDPGDADGQTCASTGHGSGTIGCDPSTCQLLFSGCSN